MKSQQHFLKNFTLQEQRNEAKRLLAKYPKRVPVILQACEGCNLKIDKHKFLVPKDLTLGEFLMVVRKRTKLKPEEALFVFVNNRIPRNTALVRKIYEEEKSDNLFLMVRFATENTFG
jgi:GABA(A) receptor-associated protein